MPKVILLVEDNDSDAALVEMALQKFGSKNHLTIVRDGEQAVNYLCRRGEHADAPTPNLVILDWNLPRMNGMEVLREVRKNPSLRNVPFVVFSGGRFGRSTERYLNDNLAFQLNKPATADSFFSAVKLMDEYVSKTDMIRPQDSDLAPLRRLAAN
jgi:two-component system, chemotaxis family, response regulator Rcp1